MTVIKHLLAYGQSDQASFRDPRVEPCFDVMTVPGTIASYFEDATAAFVLTLGKPYLIDPRTPLFQDTLASPRASHTSLADWHGPSVAAQLQASGSFAPAFYSAAVIGEMVGELVTRQRNYGGKAGGVAPKMNRYLRLLAEARGDEPPTEEPSSDGPAPDSVLLPYFAVEDVSGPWWTVMQSIWASAAQLQAPKSLRPVVCVGKPGQPLVNSVDLLDQVLVQRPQDLSSNLLFWITSLDERGADVATLARLWSVVRDRTVEGVSLTNLYGGFFSICLGLAGLDGFGNGLGYSESRQWPALDATGAAPARYYLRDLHVFAPPATAEQLVSRQPAFVCDCPVCTAARASGRSIVAMDYAELKSHFAFARSWERDVVDVLGRAGVVTQLRAALANYIAAGLPRGIRVAVDHLDRWAIVLDAATP